ncbi:YqeG family HAD IIIA-type phosphatase [Rothia nasimurium]|uniref:YqeG family HAD IIIA-type phosphatase n=1 Tax=Rothia nasimurium TaxID=85336 RepID=UPI001F003693|nr:YqeG family HAD IIIA-type phosphatase [Rothia nasimurium]
MIHLLFPHALAPDVFSIDYALLHKRGIKAIIFDIDNTLTYHGHDSTPEVDQLFRDIHLLGLKTFLLSNNSEERITDFTRNIDTQFIAMADKPRPANYLKALAQLGLKKNEVVFVGDQIFTDILGANRAGIPSILVDFIRLPEETYFGKRRDVEQIILRIYRCMGLQRKRLGNILRNETR